MASVQQPPRPSSAPSKRPMDDTRPHVRTSYAIPSQLHSILSELSTAVNLLPQPLSVRLKGAIPSRSAAYLARPRSAAIWNALFNEGYPSAATYFLLAILINHVRRMLVPWLGAWVHFTPLADLKMALGSPHYFLDELLGHPFGDVVFMLLQKGVVDFLGGLAARRTVGAKRASVGGEVAKVGVLVWALAAAEYIQARTFNAVAVVIAVWRLVSGEKAHCEVLGEVLARHWVVVPVYTWWVVYFLASGVGPLVLGACGDAVRGRPVVLGVVWATGYVTYFVTRWSNKYYIVLELWGFVMVVGWAVAGMFVLAGRAAMDILGRDVGEEGEEASQSRQAASRETDQDLSFRSLGRSSSRGHVVGQKGNETRRA